MLGFGLLILAAGSRMLRAEERPSLEFRDGDRVVLLGGTFVERLQWHDYLETLLTTAFPDRHVTFRNLGWSADTVWGDSRAVFGSQNDGFARLVKDVTEAKPTVILIAYGTNEANAGAGGLETFHAGLKRLLDTLGPTQARLALVAGHRREAAGPRLPDPTAYNANLYQYNQAIEAVCRERGLPFITLETLVGAEPIRPQRLTREGLHLTEYGQWVLAPLIAQRMGVGMPVDPPSIDAAKMSSDSVGVRDVKSSNTGVSFALTERRLGYPLQLREGTHRHEAPADVAKLIESRLRVTGLAAGKYQLRIDGQPASEYQPAEAWARPEGVAYTNAKSITQWQELRQVIHEKNQLYFHRHRPQNETYLFLFRKHEQGNNAVEIPQFDPLVAACEKKIAELRVPRAQQCELVRE
jgi:lysophospholipase L1-like esterase